MTIEERLRLIQQGLRQGPRFLNQEDIDNLNWLFRLARKHYSKDWEKKSKKPVK